MNRDEALRLLTLRQRLRSLWLYLRGGWRFVCAYEYYDDTSGFSLVWAVLVNASGSTESWVHPDGSVRQIVVGTDPSPVLESSS